MIARKLLEKKTTKAGDVVKFKGGCIGLVICHYGINECRIVNNKAILLTNRPDGRFWGFIAGSYLDEEAKIIKKVNCIKTK